MQLTSEMVARVQGPIEAEVVRGLLASYGMPVRLASALSHGVWPIAVNSLGEVRIYVQPVDGDAAREILVGHRRAGLVLVTDEREPQASREPAAVAATEAT